MSSHRKEIPSASQFDSADWKKEKKRILYKKKFRDTLKSTIAVLVVVAALAILAATLWLPVLRIYGNSMTPTLSEGNIVATVKTTEFQPGDVIAFYYNNKLLVKRVIAGPGDWVDLADDGTVYVNGKELEEPYLEEKALGETNIDYPYQVPEDRWFVMGDHRSVSLDSRTKAIGPIAEEQIVGKLIWRLWPFDAAGTL
nr:signal peptidase I [Faecalibaculum rodentium]